MTKQKNILEISKMKQELFWDETKPEEIANKFIEKLASESQLEMKKMMKWILSMKKPCEHVFRSFVYHVAHLYGILIKDEILVWTIEKKIAQLWGKHVKCKCGRSLLLFPESVAIVKKNMSMDFLIRADLRKTKLGAKRKKGDHGLFKHLFKMIEDIAIDGAMAAIFLANGVGMNTEIKNKLTVNTNLMRSIYSGYTVNDEYFEEYGNYGDQMGFQQICQWSAITNEWMSEDIKPAMETIEWTCSKFPLEADEKQDEMNFEIDWLDINAMAERYETVAAALSILEEWFDSYEQNRPADVSTQQLYAHVPKLAPQYINNVASYWSREELNQFLANSMEVFNPLSNIVPFKLYSGGNASVMEVTKNENVLIACPHHTYSDMNMLERGELDFSGWPGEFDFQQVPEVPPVPAIAWESTTNVDGIIANNAKLKNCWKVGIKDLDGDWISPPDENNETWIRLHMSVQGFDDGHDNHAHAEDAMYHVKIYRVKSQPPTPTWKWTKTKDPSGRVMKHKVWKTKGHGVSKNKSKKNKKNVKVELDPETPMDIIDYQTKVVHVKKASDMTGWTNLAGFFTIDVLLGSPDEWYGWTLSVTIKGERGTHILSENFMKFSFQGHEVVKVAKSGAGESAVHYYKRGEDDPVQIHPGQKFLSLFGETDYERAVNADPVTSVNALWKKQFERIPDFATFWNFIVSFTTMQGIPMVEKYQGMMGAEPYDISKFADLAVWIYDIIDGEENPLKTMTVQDRLKFVKYVRSDLKVGIDSIMYNDDAARYFSEFFLNEIITIRIGFKDLIKGTITVSDTNEVASVTSKYMSEIRKRGILISYSTFTLSKWLHEKSGLKVIYNKKNARAVSVYNWFKKLRNE